MGQDSKDHDGHFANYAEYSKTFRSWMVAYGIGGPILLLTSKDAPQNIAKSPYLQTIVTLFILGVAIQIVLALVNKWAAWHMYRGAYSKYQMAENDPDCNNHHDSITYKFWGWVNRQSWIDFLCDVGALLLFSVATWLVLKALLGSHP
jgi:hypothetical protein